MKYGMNMLLWTTNVDPSHDKVFEMLKECGYDGVEIPIFRELHCVLFEDKPVVEAVTGKLAPVCVHVQSVGVVVSGLTDSRFEWLARTVKAAEVMVGTPE